MEQAVEDDGFSASMILATLKKEKDALTAEKYKAIKDEAKAEQLLEDKVELKLLQ